MGSSSMQSKNNTDERAAEAGSEVAQVAKDAASFVGQKAEEATTAVGGSLKSLGQTIRENSPRGGRFGDTASALASGLENTGRYLEQEGLEGMMEEMTRLVRRNPVPALFVALGVGFLLARAFTPRS